MRVGATLSNGSHHLTIRRTGSRGESGWPAAIGAVAGPFVARLRGLTIRSVRPFAEDLAEISLTLSGSAHFDAGGMRLEILARPYGHIAATVEMFDSGLDQATLRFGITLDQTYLPPFVAALRREFPEDGPAP